MSTHITSFSNIQIASNEAADYYTFNRAFSRLYDAVTTTSANVSLSASTVIPYATLNSPGFIQFTPTAAVSGVYDNYVISSNEMNSFLTSGMLTSAGGASYPSLSGVVSGGGLLLNGLSFQYGFATAVAGGSTAATQVRILPITFATLGYMQFSQPPHLLYQILDSSSDAIKFSHKCILSGITTAGANIIVHTTQLSAYAGTAKSQFYLTWLGTGV